MKTNSIFYASLLALGLSGSVAVAQNGQTIVTPTPAPVVTDASAMPAPDHVVYLARLPSAADLTKGAAAQGTSISRIDQTSDSIVVSYQYSTGRTSTFAYRLLSSAGDGQAPIGLVSSNSSATAPRVVYAQQPAPTVIYTDPPVYYSDRYYYRSYDPAWDFWTPLAVGVGLGWFSHGWHGHGYGGGWHGGHGGWHR
jgi:hypothetical protein